MIIIYLAIFFTGFVIGAARERHLFQDKWIKSKHDLEDLKQIYLDKLENLKNGNRKSL